jgi:feruloyl-CoA synthase
MTSASPITVENGPDGAIYLRAVEPLGAYPERLTERLAHWAKVAPDRVLLSRRGPDGALRELRYGAAMETVRRLGQALLDRGLSAERPLAILSGADIDHALLALAATHVGVLYSPVSPAYSLMSIDHEKLRSVLGALNPGLVFVDDAVRYGAALTAAVGADVEVTTPGRPAADRATTAFADLLATEPTEAVERAHATIRPDSLIKIMFTSGSTGAPKGVINTHRMLCSNQQQILQTLHGVAEEPLVLVDWLPWHHTFGANHNFNMALYNGGTFHIDTGRPMPGDIAATVALLRTVSPTLYFNVPKGYEMLLPYLREDAQLRASFFGRMHALFYAAASLPQPIWDELEAMALAERGVRIPFLTSLGQTETAPTILTSHTGQRKAGVVGLPCPGVGLKLAPVNGKLEARVSGPNITPGYWKRPDLSQAAFDEEGYFRTGDALSFADPARPEAGLTFDGRIGEDFKLSSGSWVSAGPLKLRLLEALAPYAREAVLTGHDRNEIHALIFPDPGACPDLDDAALHGALRDRLQSLAAVSEGATARVTRLGLLVEPPSLDAGEVTDKGSINQRRVLDRRAGLVEALHGDGAGLTVIEL